MLIRGPNESQQSWDDRVHQYRLSIGYYGGLYDQDEDTDDQLNSGHGRDITVRDDELKMGEAVTDDEYGEGPVRYDDGIPVYTVEGTDTLPAEPAQSSPGITVNPIGWTPPVYRRDDPAQFEAEGTAHAPGSIRPLTPEQVARFEAEGVYIAPQAGGTGANPPPTPRNGAPRTSPPGTPEAPAGPPPRTTSPDGSAITSLLQSLVSAFKSSGGTSAAAATGGQVVNHFNPTLAFNPTIEKILDVINTVGGATATASATIRNARQFGMTEGEIAKDYFESAFPGTTPWERLGATPQIQPPQESQNLANRQLQRAQLLNQTRNTIITAWGHAAGKMLEQGMSPKQISKLTPQINALMKQLGLPTDDMKGNRPFGPDTTPQGQLTKQQIKQSVAQVLRWEAQTSHETIMREIEQAKVNIARAENWIKQGTLEVEQAKLKHMEADVETRKSLAASAEKQAEAALSQADTAGKALEIQRTLAGIQQARLELDEDELALSAHRTDTLREQLLLAEKMYNLDEAARKQTLWGLAQFEEALEQGTLKTVAWKLFESMSGPALAVLLTLIPSLRLVRAATSAAGRLGKAAKTYNTNRKGRKIARDVQKKFDELERKKMFETAEKGDKLVEEALKKRGTQGELFP